MNDEEKIKDIEDALVELWSHKVKPTHIQMRLKEFRENCAKFEPLLHAVEFLKQTADVSEEAIVVMTPSKLTLLTDEKGNLILFK